MNKRIPPTSARELIAMEEGRKHVAYPDQYGIPTIGIGHKDRTMVLGATTWNEEKINTMFEADYIDKVTGLTRALPWFGGLDSVRQAYVVSMAFQMGLTGALGFHNTLDCLRLKQWMDAAAGVRHSKWYGQTHDRAERAAVAFETGAWQ
jgi:lysozyme